MTKITGFIFSLTCISLLNLTLNLLAQTIEDTQLKNIDNLPNDSDQMITWTCNNQGDTVVVEATEDQIWSSIIESNNWTCQQQLSDIPTGALQFTCEPTEDGSLNILTVTWLSGKDENKQMGQWIHQFAEEYNMMCSMAKVGLLDDVEQ
ncbi:hypothetical protein [Cyanothece sp. BG0011]|uniref:hypothetical protein n=1 Tax=Cyanothece sp. BG0011 TaxID=2082950 RepID=UPI000D1F7EFA|nr:hypothetical protein [Cyanothece sp. BG0011]